MPSTFLPLKALSFYTSQLVLRNANSNITTLNVSRIGSQSNRYILTICLPSMRLVRDWCCWQNVYYIMPSHSSCFSRYVLYVDDMMHIFSIVLVLRIAESRLFTMCNTNTRLFYKWRWHHFLWGLSFFSFTIATTAGCILYCLYILFRWKKNCVTRVHTWMCNSKLSSIMIHWGSTTRVRIITT